jgi:hypothetical protein
MNALDLSAPKFAHEISKNYMEDDEKDVDIRNIGRHTIGEVEPTFDFKQIQKSLKNKHYKLIECEKATVVKTE